MTAHRSTVRAGLAVLGLLAVLTAGCTSSGDSSPSGSAAVGSADPAAGSPRSTSSPGAAQGADGAKSTSASVLSPRKVVTASVEVRVRDLGDATARVRSLAAAPQIVLADEQVTRDHGDGRATFTLRLPPEVLDRTIDDVVGLGTELRRSQSADDVELTLVDLQSRATTQQASVTRVQQLLGSAKNLSDVIALEGALTQRTGDLESLQAQRTSLQGQVERATLSVTLLGGDAALDRSAGFIGGLGGGWHALTASAGLALAVLGAVLPFAVLAAVVGVPAWVLLRRHRRARRS
ncbi:MAG: DUF4349 domain-containing protein [Mycobacteriaceae bacterium]